MCYLQAALDGPEWEQWVGSSSAGRRAPSQWEKSWWSKLQECYWWCCELGPSSARWTPGNAHVGPALHTGRAVLCSSLPPCGQQTEQLLLLYSNFYVYYYYCVILYIIEICITFSFSIFLSLLASESSLIITSHTLHSLLKTPYWPSKVELNWVEQFPTLQINFKWFIKCKVARAFAVPYIKKWQKCGFYVTALCRSEANKMSQNTCEPPEGNIQPLIRRAWEFQLPYTR